MSISLFVDKSHQPSWEDIHQAIGSRLVLWNGLVDYLRGTYAPQEDLTFLYGMKYGWALRMRVKNKLLVNLYPGENSFVVQVNLPAAVVEQGLQLNLGEHARAAFQRAFPYPEGRWLFIQVETESDIEDIRNLLALRAQALKL